MANKIHVTITMSGEVLKEIDKRRGLIPRSTYIESKFRPKGARS